MRTRIRLPDGIEVWIDAPREEVQRAIGGAMENLQMIDVNSANGTITINPFQIIYIEDGERKGRESNPQAPEDHTG